MPAKVAISRPPAGVPQSPATAALKPSPAVAKPIVAQHTPAAVTQAPVVSAAQLSPVAKQSPTHTELEPVTAPALGIPDSGAYSNIHGFVIGINEYTNDNIKNLRGAVGDATAVRDFLIKDLKVPENQIKAFFNKDATRANIIKAFQDLAVDETIRKDDPIVIFYAGHGGELDAPKGWPTGGRKIQSMIPHDESFVYGSGEPTPAIPDYVIGQLLNNIAKAKGNNISVIFDCCHSTGGTRDTERMSRSVDSENLTPMTLDIDKDIVGISTAPRLSALVVEPQVKLGPGGKDTLTPDTRGGPPPKPVKSEGAGSHVLLAACGALECAWESKDARGQFTVALLEALRSAPLDLTTYTGLIAKLPALPSQMPQCEGKNASRVLFSSSEASTGPRLIPVRLVGDQYILQSGSAQGIMVGAQYDLYRNTLIGSHNPALSRFSVAQVVGVKSILVKMDDVPLPAASIFYAKQVLGGKDYGLTVFLTPDIEKVVGNDPRWKQENGSHSEYRVVQEASLAELVVHANRDEASFELKNKLIQDSGMKRLPYSVKATAEEISDIARVAARWSWHLNRTNPQDPFKGKVKIEMTLLDDSAGSPVPVGENLNQTGVVNLALDSDVVYGFKLVNNSVYDLYPYVFYFDAADLSADAYYQGSIGGIRGADPQLPGRGRQGSYPPGELALGYGSGGADAIAFSPPEAGGIKVVILKIFLTTSPTNFDTIPILTPFNLSIRQLTTRDFGAADRADLWGAMMLVINIRRK